MSAPRTSNSFPRSLAQATSPDRRADTPLQVLVPAFMISELRRAFEIGFLLFIPFLIIDLVVSSILISMGMMMVPPVTVSLPFKLIFFVLVDGGGSSSAPLCRVTGDEPTANRKSVRGALFSRQESV